MKRDALKLCKRILARVELNSKHELLPWNTAELHVAKLSSAKQPLTIIDNRQKGKLDRHAPMPNLIIRQKEI
jgi:hypothetical protein